MLESYCVRVLGGSVVECQCVRVLACLSGSVQESGSLRLLEC